jgi:hypothetical protein
MKLWAVTPVYLVFTFACGEPPDAIDADEQSIIVPSHDWRNWYPVDRGQRIDGNDAERVVNWWGGHTDPAYPYFGQSTLRFPGVPQGLPARGRSGSMAGRYYYNWPCASADECELSSFFRRMEIITQGDFYADPRGLEHWAEGTLKGRTAGIGYWRVFYEMPPGGCTRQGLEAVGDGFLTSADRKRPLLYRLPLVDRSIPSPRVCAVAFKSWHQALRVVEDGLLVDNVDWSESGAWRVRVENLPHSYGSDVIKARNVYERNGRHQWSEVYFMRYVDWDGGVAAKRRNGFGSYHCYQEGTQPCAMGLPIWDDESVFLPQWCFVDHTGTPRCAAAPR